MQGLLAQVLQLSRMRASSGLDESKCEQMSRGFAPADKQLAERTTKRRENEGSRGQRDTFQSCESNQLPSARPRGRGRPGLEFAPVLPEIEEDASTTPVDEDEQLASPTSLPSSPSSSPLSCSNPFASELDSGGMSEE